MLRLRYSRKGESRVLTWLAFAVLVVLPLYAIAAIVAIKTGLFDLRPEPLSPDEVRALWGFLGASVATAITLIGYLITNAQVRKSEGRLGLDSSVNGLQLISNTERTKYAPPAVVAGALAALVHLGQPTIAIRTLRAAWADEAVDRASAAWTVSEVLANRTNAAKEAARFLLTIADSLAGAQDGERGDLAWPEIVRAGWIPWAEEPVRAHVLNALQIAILSRPYPWWWGTATLSATIWTLYDILKKDKSQAIKSGAAEFLLIVLRDFPADGRPRREGGGVKVDVMRRVAEKQDKSVQYNQLADNNDRLKKWAADRQQFYPDSSGASDGSQGRLAPERVALAAEPKMGTTAETPLSASR